MILAPMRAPLTIILSRFAEALPGWLFIAAGLALLGGAVLVPARASNQQLIWQRDVLEAQARLMSDQRQRYADYHEDLVNMDPLLLERLAYSQLRFKPADYQLWSPTANQIEAATWQATSHADAGLGLIANDLQASNACVDAILAEPIANVQPTPPAQSKPSRLVRLATGTSRLGLMVAAIAFILGGIGFGGGEEEGTEAPRDRGTEGFEAAN